jgi:hypothetical protein
MDEPSVESAPTPESGRSRSHDWTLILWAFVLLFVVYPLSVGPAAKLYFMKVIPGRPVEAFYAPLGFAVNRSPGLERFFAWYLDDLWKVRPRSAPVVTPPPQGGTTR